MKQNRHARPGFTLVEMLVVLALIVVLGAMTVAYLPNAANSERESRAATLVQGWLNVARQRALRDQAPRGLRLWVGSATIGATAVPDAVTQCQYIEKPDDFAPIPGQGMQLISDVPQPQPVGSPYNPQNTIAFFFPPMTLLNSPGKFVDGTSSLRNGLPYNPVTLTTDQQFWGVQTNDWIEIYGSGLIHQIVQIGVTDKGGKIYPDYMVINPPLTAPILPGQETYNYRIQRAPRAVGNELLELPPGTMIDVGTNLAATGLVPLAYNNPLPWGNTLSLAAAPIPPLAPIAAGYYVDILFSPTGAVITPGITQPTLNLWVRAPDEKTPANINLGSPTIIAVHVATGAVGAYPQNIPAAGKPNPYYFVQ